MTGFQTVPVNPDLPRFETHERVVLKKYDGDDHTVLPQEVILVEDGQITGRWEGQEVARAPSE